MIGKLHKQVLLLIMMALMLSNTFESCSVVKTGSNAPEYATDLVCGMKVDKAEAYMWKYKEVEYYFCSYNCKETFKMNPRQVLDKCAEKND